MRKTIFAIGFYVICLSIFSFYNDSSYATPNDEIVPNNAINDLIATEGRVDDQRDKANEAWALVDMADIKWGIMSDENRRKNTLNFLIEMMGSGFWATAGGLEGRGGSEYKSVYRNKSLMDLYSDELENVKNEINLFYIMVPVYNSAHAHAINTVYTHEASHHDPASPSNVPHFVPDWENKTCRDDLPSFLCRANYLSSGTCQVTYPTPGEAYYTHQRVCGEEDPPDGHWDPPAGDGKIYYTCDEVRSAQHQIRTCSKGYVDTNGDKGPCLDSRGQASKFRRCTNSKQDHNANVWGISYHSDDATSTEQQVAETDSTPTPTPATYHACNTHETWQSGVHSAASCGTSGHYTCDGSDHSSTSCGGASHYVCDGLTHQEVQCSSTSGSDQCTYTYWDCLNDGTPSHNHAYPAPTLVACPYCKQSVSTREAHKATCSYGHDYWTCKSGATENHTAFYTCKRTGCTARITQCAQGTCISNWGTQDRHWLK